MSGLDDALREVRRLDALSAGDSFPRRVHPLWKLLLTLWRRDSQFLRERRGGREH